MYYQSLALDREAIYIIRYVGHWQKHIIWGSRILKYLCGSQKELVGITQFIAKCTTYEFYRLSIKMAVSAERKEGLPKLREILRRQRDEGDVSVSIDVKQ